ncbi:MAG TPA: ArsC/Spx/MgsR family protein, partial [Acidimicrobiales bacterium]
KLTLYHNPKCSTSNHALSVVQDAGVDVEIVQYLKTPPDRATLEHIVEILDDPVEDLVRKDANFEKLGLNADDYVGNANAVIDLLLEHPELMQRPVLVKGKKAIIGRPKDRVAPFIGA